MGSIFSGLTGSGATQRTSSQQTNFLPFQQPAINSLFGALGGGIGDNFLLGGVDSDSLLQFPPAAGALANSGLSGFQGQLDRFQRRPADSDLRGLLDVSRDVSRLPAVFNPITDRFEELADSFETLTNAELNRNPVERATDFLLPFARGDFLDRGNPFADRIVQSAIDDATARTAATFEGAGRLRSGSAPRAVAREAGRISGDIRGRIFESERGRQLGAATTIGQLDLNDAIRRLNAIGQGGQLRLGATQGILSSVLGEEGTRLNSLGLAGNIGNNLAGLQQQSLFNSVPFANQFAELPFVPITNFANVASLPLGGSATSTTRQRSQGSPLKTALGLGLSAASLKPGSPGTLASTGVAGFGPFGSNLGPLAGGGFPPLPIAG